MSGGHMPAAGLCCFVFEETKMDGIRDFGEESGEIEVGWGILGGIATEDNECLDAAFVDGSREVSDRSRFQRISFDWQKSCANVAEGGVDRIDESLQRGRGERTGDDDRTTRVRCQIGGAFFDPIRIDCRLGLRKGLGDGCEVGVLGFIRDGESELASEFTELRGPAAQAVIGHAAGDRVVVLHGVEAVHRRAILLGTTPRGETLSEADSRLDGI